MAWVKTEHLEKFSKMFAEKVTEIFAKKTEIPKSLPAAGGDSETVNGHTVEADVPEGAVFTDTKYTHPTGPGNEHLPAGGVIGQILKINSEGEAEWGAETDTRYNLMTAATDSTDGTSGLVPAPGKGKQNAFLKGDGSWEEMIEATDDEIDAIVTGLFE